MTTSWGSWGDSPDYGDCTENREALALQKLIDEAGTHFTEVTCMLYGVTPWDPEMLERYLEELGYRIGMDIPKRDLAVIRKPYLS